VQKKLLEKGLRAHYRTPLGLAGRSANPGCFGLKESRAFDMGTGQRLPILDHRKRANRRAAAGHAVTRLCKRGLVECCSRGTWRLTPSGVKVAKKLYPEILPLSKREVASTIAFREAVHAVSGSRRSRKKPRTKAPQAPKRVALAGEVAEPGLEIEMDW
jgi:restriction endonuclease Mrr